MAFAVSAVVAGQIVGRTGRDKRSILALLLFGMIGALLLSRLTTEATVAELALGLAIMGLALGGLFVTLIVVVQNIFPHRSLGEVTAGLWFFGALGAALLAPFLPWSARGAILDPLGRPPPALPDAWNNHVAEPGTLGVVSLVTALLMAVGFVLALWFPETPETRKTASIAPTKPTSSTIHDVPTIAQRRHAREAQPPTTDRAVDDASGTAPPTGVPKPPAR